MAAGDPPDLVEEADAGHVAPTVGNILGLSLLFRDRRALLHLPRRGLAPGIRLTDFESELTHVALPIRGSLSASRFRHHRTRAVSVVLHAEARGLRDWLSERWLGTLGEEELARCGAFHAALSHPEAGYPDAEASPPAESESWTDHSESLVVLDLELELRAGDPALAPPTLQVALTGRTSLGRRVTLIALIPIVAEGRFLTLRPSRLWLFGESHLRVNGLWRAFAARLTPQATLTDHGGQPCALRCDATRLALLSSFAAAGFRAPSVADLSLQDIALQGRNLVMRFSADDGAPVGSRGEVGLERRGTARRVDDDSNRLRTAETPTPPLEKLSQDGPTPDDVAVLLQAARAALRDPSDRRQDALEELERVAALVHAIQPAAIACARWRAEIARFGHPVALLRALRAWLDLQPSDREASRLLVIALARAGETRELAQLLASELRMGPPTRSRLLLELALANLLVERLRDPRTALSILTPAIEQLRREGRGSSELLAQALVTLAQARAADASARRGVQAPHVLEALDEALELLRRPPARAAARTRVAQTFARIGHDQQALHMMMQAIEEDPDSTDALDFAIDLAGSLQQHDSMASLIELRVKRAHVEERHPLRRRLIPALLKSEDPKRRAQARREIERALAVDPDDLDLLRAALQIDREQGKTNAVDEVLARLVDLSAMEDRPVVVLERVRALLLAGRRDFAWEILRPFATDYEELSNPTACDVLTLASQLAPVGERPRIFERLITVASGEALASALAERASFSITTRERIDYLQRAVVAASDPREYLRKLESLLSEDDLEELGAVAEHALEAGEYAVEMRSRWRLARGLTAREEHQLVVRELRRVIALAEDHSDIAWEVADARDLLIDALEKTERWQDAYEELFARLRASDLSPRQRADLAIRAADVAGRAQRPDDAAELRLIALRAMPKDDGRSEAMSSQLFDDLVGLGRHAEANELARRRSNQGEPATRAAWLLRIAGGEAPHNRRRLLEQAHALAPSGDTFAALVVSLNALGDGAALVELGRSSRARAVTEDDVIVSLRLMLEHTAPSLRWRLEPEILDELALRVPEDLDAALASCERAYHDGRFDDARGHAQRLFARADPNDTRIFLPALVLAEAALQSDDSESAEKHVRLALSISPGSALAREFADRVARAQGDPAKINDASAALLELIPETPATQLRRSELLLDRARALALLHRMPESYACFQATCALVPAQTLSHLAVAQEWIRAVRADADAGAPALVRALAEQRRALGRNLPINELDAEVGLLADALGLLDDAFALLAEAILSRDAPALLLARLGHLATQYDRREQQLSTLERALDSTGDAGARDRVALELARSARAYDKPELVLLALHRMRGRVAEEREQIELRLWASRATGRLGEMRADAETRLVLQLDDARTPAESQHAVAAFTATYDDDQTECAQRLLHLRLESAVQAHRALLLETAARVLLDSSAPSLTSASVLLTCAAALQELAVLSAALWLEVEHFVRVLLDRERAEFEASEQISRPESFAAARAHILGATAELALRCARSGLSWASARVDDWLDQALLADPLGVGVATLLVDRTRHGTGVGPPPRSSRPDSDSAEQTLVDADALADPEPPSSAALDWHTIDIRLRALASRAQLTGRQLAQLRIGWAGSVEPVSAGAALASIALSLRDDTEAFEIVRDALRARRLWLSLIAVQRQVESQSQDEEQLKAWLAVDAAEWLAIAAGAAGDHDLASEAQARAMAGMRLFDCGERRLAAVEFETALRLEPEAPLVRWKLAFALSELGDDQRASTQVESLLMSDSHEVLGLTWSTLALRAGTLRLRLGRSVQAAVLLEEARLAAAGDPVLRDAIAHVEIEAHLASDNTAAAARVARAVAREQALTTEELAWLDRCSDLIAHDSSAGVALVDALARAWTLDPESPSRYWRLHEAMRVSEGEDAAKSLLRAQALSDAGQNRSDEGALTRLRAACKAAGSVESPLEGAQNSVLLERRVELESESADAVIALADSVANAGDIERAMQLWARGLGLAPSPHIATGKVAQRLARSLINHGSHEAARPWIEVALADDAAIDSEFLDVSLSLARLLEDHALRLRCAFLLRQRDSTPARAQSLELELARAKIALESDAADLSTQRRSLDANQPLLVEARAHLRAASMVDGGRSLAIATLAAALWSELSRQWVAQLESLSEAPTTALDPEDVQTTQVSIEKIASASSASAPRTESPPLSLSLSLSLPIWPREPAPQDALYVALSELADALAAEDQLTDEHDPTRARREIDVLKRLVDRTETALLRIERALLAVPDDVDLRAILVELCERRGCRERLVQVLRTVTEGLDDSAEKQDLAKELALAARSVGAARAASWAIEQLPPLLAATEEFLDIHEWALRELGTVDEELDSIVQSLVDRPDDELLLARMLRLLEHDVVAVAQRIVLLASGLYESRESSGRRDSSDATVAVQSDGHAADALVQRACNLLRERAPAAWILRCQAAALAIRHASPAWSGLNQFLNDLRAAKDLEEQALLALLTDVRPRAQSSSVSETTGSGTQDTTLDLPRSQEDQLKRDSSASRAYLEIWRIGVVALPLQPAIILAFPSPTDPDRDHKLRSREADLRDELPRGVSDSGSDVSEASDQAVDESNIDASIIAELVGIACDRSDLRDEWLAESSWSLIQGRSALARSRLLREILREVKSQIDVGRDPRGQLPPLAWQLADEGAESLALSMMEHARLPDAAAGHALLELAARFERAGSPPELCARAFAAAASRFEGAAQFLAAREALAAAVTHDGENAGYRRALARSHRRSGNPTLALEVLAPLLSAVAIDDSAPLEANVTFDDLVEAGELALVNRDSRCVPWARRRQTLARESLDPSLTQDAAESLWQALEIFGTIDQQFDLAVEHMRRAGSATRLVWTRRAAQVATLDRRMALLSEAFELDPDQRDIEDQLEAELRRKVDLGALDRLLRARLPRTQDPLERSVLLEELLSRVDAARQQDRLVLLENLAAVAEDPSAALIEIADLTGASSPSQALEALRRALGHLAESDPRRLQLRLRVVELMIHVGEVVGANAVLATVNDDSLRVDDVETAQRVARLRLRVAILRADDGEESAAIEALLGYSGGEERAMLLARLSELVFARGELIAAADHLAAAVSTTTEPRKALPWIDQWLTYAASPELDEEARAAMEAQARAARRHLQGAELPAKALRVECLLLLERLNRPDEALGLAAQALKSNPSSADALALLDDLGRMSGRESEVTETLFSILQDERDLASQDALAERMALLLNERNAPDLVLRSLHFLTLDRSFRPQALALREWAIRARGEVEAERRRIEEELRVCTDPRWLATYVERMGRMLDGSARATISRLLPVAREASGGPEADGRGLISIALAECLLELARETATADLDSALAVAAFLAERGSFGGIVSRWDELDHLSREANDAACARCMLHIATQGARARIPALMHAVEAWMDIVVRLDAGARELRDAIWLRGEQRSERGGAAGEVRELALAEAIRFSSTAQLRGVDYGAFWVTFVEHVEAPLAATILLGRGLEQHSDDDVIAVIGTALRDSDALPELLELTSARPLAASEDFERLEQLALRAAQLGDAASEGRARARMGRGLAAARQFERATRQLERAFALRPQADEVRYALGDVLAGAGRADAALEHLLPLVGAGTAADAARIQALGVHQATLIERCATLLVATGQHERALELMVRALALHTDEVSKTALAEQMVSLLELTGSTQGLWELTLDRVEATSGAARIPWLVRAARLTPERAPELLREAHALDPNDQVLTELLLGALPKGSLKVQAERLDLLNTRFAAALSRVERDLALHSTNVPWRDGEVGTEGNGEPHGSDQAQAQLAQARVRALDCGRELLAELGGAQVMSADVGALIETLVRLDPVGIDTQWLLASHLQGTRAPRAVEEWRRLLTLVAREPTREDAELAALRVLAPLHIEHEDFDAAHTLLLRALTIVPGDVPLLRLRLAAAQRLHARSSYLAASADLLSQSTPRLERIELLVGRSRVLASAGNDGSPATSSEMAQAINCMAEAWELRSQDPAGSGAQGAQELAEHWLALSQEAAQRLTLSGAERARLLVDARRALREAAGASLSPEAANDEINAYLEHLQDVGEALALVDARLKSHPDERATLDRLREISLLERRPTLYVDALERALHATADATHRDALATQLAYAALETDDAERVLLSLSRASQERREDPALIDIRQWAIRKLDRVADELDEVERELFVVDRIEGPLLRLRSLFEDDTAGFVQRISELAPRMEQVRARQLLEVCWQRLLREQPELESIDPAQPASAHDKSNVFKSGATRCLPATFLLAKCCLGQHPTLAARVWKVGANLLVAAPQSAAVLLSDWQIALEVGFSIRQHRELAAALENSNMEDSAAQDAVRVRDASDSQLLDELSDHAIARFPSKISLLLSVLGEATSGAEPARGKLRALANRVVARVSLRGRSRASVWIGLASLLSRPDSALLLRGEADSIFEEDLECTYALIEHLEELNHWPEVTAILMRLAQASAIPEQRVAAFKQLAHIRADVLGDDLAAIEDLESALLLSPDDPDLLLPLLDAYYSRRDTARAIELSLRVLQAVPMGVAAYATVAHRAADSALARGEHRLAVELLGTVLERYPEDERTRERLVELARMENDPEHRSRMLTAIAARQLGAARLDALEERARLLVGPLNRPLDAQRDLEAILAEDPTRDRAASVLQGLYEQSGAHDRMAALLENRVRGSGAVLRRGDLIRLGRLYAGPLDDLARAERSFRSAREELDDGDDNDQADALVLELARVLHRMARYDELRTLVEGVLAPQFAPEAAQDAPLAPARLELATMLGAALREKVHDLAAASVVYERLDAAGQLPEDGLATLARHYRASSRHEDLVRILMVRSRALAEAGDTERRAEVDSRIGELLDGPLRRPHHAAPYFLDAYLANPIDHAGAGARARLLLSATTSVANVRVQLHSRIQNLGEDVRPFAHLLLAEILAVQDGYEGEAEAQYKFAVQGTARSAAREGLGRLLLRLGREDEGVEALALAARDETFDADRCADAAALAAPHLVRVGRSAEAKALLEQAIARDPTHDKAMLELAGVLHDRAEFESEEALLLRCAALKLAASARAEVCFRRAVLLQPRFTEHPLGDAGETARTLLLESVGADAGHSQARQLLMDLAARRSEWSIVTHMQLLAAREIPPGEARAQLHADLAETYLQRLRDFDGAMRNLSSALAQPIADASVHQRIARLLAQISDRSRAASYLSTAIDGQRLALGDLTITPVARARLLFAAAELWERNDEIAAAERAYEQILAIEAVPASISARANKQLELLSSEDHDQRRELKHLQAELDLCSDDASRVLVLRKMLDSAISNGDAALSEGLELRIVAILEAHLLSDHTQTGTSGIDPDSARRWLREIFTQRGDPSALVREYERLAARVGDSHRASEMLVDAARSAWSSVRDAAAPTALLEQSLLLVPDSPSALLMLGEVTSSIAYLAADELLCAVMATRQANPSQAPAPLSVTLATVASADRQGKRELAETLLAGIKVTELDNEQHDAVLRVVDDRLLRGGRSHARIAPLGQRLELASKLQGPHADARVADLTLRLAGILRELGRFEEVRRHVTELLASRGSSLPAPSRLAAQRLLIDALLSLEDFSALADAFTTLAELEIEPEAKAREYRQAAKYALGQQDGGASIRTASAEARRRALKLLERARELAPLAAGPRVNLLPLLFAAGEWSAVLDVSVELRAISGDEDEELMFGALVEALVHGRRSFARAIGPRHEREVRERVLYPAYADLVDLIASEGPLPRLDAVLGAAAAMTGDTEDFLAELVAWSTSHAIRPGIALTLGRLHEAFGATQQTRWLYQLASFVAPQGPVGLLATRLAEPELPADPLQQEDWVPLAWRGSLRETLITLRDYHAGIRGRGGDTVTAEGSLERAAFHAATGLVGRLRPRVGLQVVLAFTREPLYAGVGLRNRVDPTLVVDANFLSVPEAEREFRVALAMMAMASGLGMLTDTHPVSPAEVLGALSMLARPNVPVASEGAHVIADALASRGLRPAMLPASLRQGLARELEHWLDRANGLEHWVALLRRALLLAGARLSGRLDGALLAIARDQDLVDPDGRPDANAVLGSDDARWLLAQLGLRGDL